MNADTLNCELNDGCDIVVTNDARVLLMAREQEKDVTGTPFGAQMLETVSLLTARFD